MNNYRDELIQVAAVALAMIQVEDTGSTRLDVIGDKVMNEISLQVQEERDCQEKKWGVQSHTREKWLAILMEEVGEVAKAILEAE